MTAQEQAIEIAEKHYWLFGDGYLGTQHIQHALIQVEGIINVCSEDESAIITQLQYWQQVKNELLNHQKQKQKELMLLCIG